MLNRQSYIFHSNDLPAVETEFTDANPSLDFGSKRAESDLCFGTIESVKEETILPENAVVRQVDRFVDIIIVPILGTIAYKDSLGNHLVVESGQMGFLSVQEGMAYELSNRCGAGIATYLQICLNADGTKFHRGIQRVDFKHRNRNELFPIFFGRHAIAPSLKSNSDTCGSIGSFPSEKGGRYLLKSARHGLFAFVINGAFNVNGHILSQHEFIFLGSVSGVEFKAVFENSCILLIEVPK